MYLALTLRSMASNPRVTFVFVTDLAPPPPPPRGDAEEGGTAAWPPNVRAANVSFAQLFGRCRRLLRVEVRGKYVRGP